MKAERGGGGGVGVERPQAMIAGLTCCRRQSVRLVKLMERTEIAGCVKKYLVSG
jgi:hypothetical protein